MPWSKSKIANVTIKGSVSAGMVIVGSMFVAVSTGQVAGLGAIASRAGYGGGNVDIEKEKLNLTQLLRYGTKTQTENSR